MPILQNSRHEAFAQARARGAALKDAFEDAGYAPDASHASRLGREPLVAERIAELRGQQVEMADAGPQAVIAALLRTAKAAEAKATPASLREVRLTLLEVDRLREALLARRHGDRAQAEFLAIFPDLSAS